jgi:drug/metabolite transporter (DMT)-like permease
MLSLSAALTSAVAMLGLHRLKGLDPWAIVVHYSGVATLVVLGAWAIGDGVDLAPLHNPTALLLLLGVGVAATVGQLCVTQAYTFGQPARVAVVGLMQCVFALGLDLLFAGPYILPVTLAGIGLVLLPTAWVMVGKAAREEGGRAPQNASLGSTEQAA